MIREDIAIISQNFLLWAEPAPPLFAHKIQIQDMEEGKSLPCPQWSCCGAPGRGREGRAAVGLHSPEPGHLGSSSALRGKLPLYAALWMIFSSSHRTGGAEAQGCWAWSMHSPNPSPGAVGPSRRWQPAVPYCSCWFMNQHVCSFTGASLLLLPFFKVTFISLLTSESPEHVFLQHPDRRFIFSHIQSLFLLPLVIRAGCFVLSNTSPYTECCFGCLEATDERKHLVCVRDGLKLGTFWAWSRGNWSLHCAISDTHLGLYRGNGVTWRLGLAMTSVSQVSGSISMPSEWGAEAALKYSSSLKMRN